MVFRSDFILPKGYKIKIPLEWSGKESLAIANLNKIKQKKLIDGGTMAYKIRRGESLYWISKKFNVPLRRIIASNNIVNPSRLYPGQLIHIPVGKDSKAPVKALFPSVAKKAKEVKKSSDKSLAVFKKGAPIKKKGLVSQRDLGHYNLNLAQIKGGTFKVQVEVNETLGHYSDWAGIPLSALRKINNYSPRKKIRVGSKVNNFKINGMKKYVVKRGDTIDGLTKNFSLPLWLIRKYQQKQKGYNLFEGQVLNIPQVVALQENI
jgi:membrane-bound lytic murein transglycosylase D